MKKANLTIIATAIATFVISMIAFQPTTIEASNNVSPSATPSPRKIRKTSRQSIEVENDETHLMRKPITKVKSKKSTYKEGGVNDTTHRTRKIKPKKPAGFQEISGIGMEVTSSKKSGQAEVQYNPKELSVDKSVKRKSSKNEVSIETVERKKQLRKRKN